VNEVARHAIRPLSEERGDTVERLMNIARAAAALLHQTGQQRRQRYQPRY
jgi:hypothetical protein